jgi:hypothetical protein
MGIAEFIIGRAFARPVGSTHRAVAGGWAEHVRSARVLQTSTCCAIGLDRKQTVNRWDAKMPTRSGLTLNFENGTIHGIRSVSQRALAVSWAQLCNEGLPSFDRFDPEPGIHDPKQLVAWKVETRDGQLVFRALYRGRLVDEAFNDGWTGKTLREVTPPSLQPAIIGASEHCVSTGCAVYTVLRTHGGAGFPVELERLLLPFGKNGRVKIIVASLQLISLEGTVERGKIAKDFEAQSETVLSIRVSAASINKSSSKPVVTSDGFV